MLNSPNVNSQILCLLLASGFTQSCGGPPVVASDAQRAQPRRDSKWIERAAQQRQPTFFVSGRVEAAVPSQNLKLAEENEVSLRILVPGITKFSTEQIRYGHETADPASKMVPREGIREAAADLPILHRNDGSAYIKVVPLRLGQVKLNLLGRYPDGGIVQLNVMLNVELPSRQPKKLFVGQMGLPGTTSPWAFVYLEPEGRRFALAVSALYDNVEQEIPIGAQYVKFKVRTANDSPVVELDDSTGSMKPLRTGEELVEVSFAGWKNLTCVEVEEKFDPNKTGPTPDCKSLLLPGERLGVPTREADTP